MKYIKSKKISKKKYLLTLEVSDYDLEMLEDLATKTGKEYLKPCELMKSGGFVSMRK